MTTTSAFSQSPEELLDEARRYRTADADSLLLIDKLGRALEKERNQRGTAAEIIKAQSRDYRVLEKEYRLLLPWRIIGILSIPTTLIALAFAIIFGHHHCP